MVTYRLVRNTFPVDKILAFVDIAGPFANGDDGQATTTHGYPAASAIVTHHHLCSHSHQMVPTKRDVRIINN